MHFSDEETAERVRTAMTNCLVLRRELVRYSRGWGG